MASIKNTFWNRYVNQLAFGKNTLYIFLVMPSNFLLSISLFALTELKNKIHKNAR